MPSYYEVAQDTSKFDGDQMQRMLFGVLNNISELRGKHLGGKFKDGTHVVFYASGFFQAGDDLSADAADVSPEDINGFMQALHGVKEKSLTLVLHTPGGDAAAVESIVGYLRPKFEYIEVIVPAYAMSAGTMISLAGDHIIMSQAGQLGPVDSQFHGHSARVIHDALGVAEDSVVERPKTAKLWGILLRQIGGVLLPLTAVWDIEHSRKTVKKFLESGDLLKSNEKAEQIARYFNAEPSDYDEVLTHYQRIGLEKLRKMGLNVKALEGEKQELQDAVMEAYWLMTRFFELTRAAKFIASSQNPPWVRPPMPPTED